ncbi:MAG: TetR/AcrR family transcriptional regulator [Pseudomonadota bacterium]
MAKKTAQRAKALEKIETHLLTTGLAETGVRQLAAAAGISDRMLLYYFEDKTDVLTAALSSISAKVVMTLSAAIPPDMKISPPELITITTELTRGEAMGAEMRLFVECVAAAARGEVPYESIAKQIMEGFLIWVDAHLDIESADERKAAAAMILALVDGIALLEICTDELRGDMAVKAAAQMLE